MKKMKLPQPYFMKSKIQLVLTLLLLVSVNTLPAQQFLDKTLLHDGEIREYSIYIPASYQGTSQVPLLFNFHGGDGDIASQLYIADMRPIADTAGFILVYPQALPDPQGGGATSWMHKEPTTVDDIYFVEAMIDTIAAEYMIDEERVYACGYSNGGEFSFELSCRLNDRIAAMGSVARSMYIGTYDQCAPIHPTAVVTIHGTEDDYNGITWQGVLYYLSLDDVNSYWTNMNNTDSIPTIVQLPDIDPNDGSTVEHYSWENGDGCVSVEHFKVIGGDHDWPGTFGNMDIDATIEIWKFVSRFNVNGLIGCTTSVQDENEREKDIHLYPNPAKDNVTIEMDLTNKQEYYIYSVLGELIVSGTIHSDNNTINISGLPSNIFLLRIENKTLLLIKTN